MQECHMALTLGAIDFFSDPGATQRLVQDAEKFGLSRYWITHHSGQPSPTLTVGMLAGTTDEIRIGTAAILLRYYSPYQTALDFLSLEALFPGRIAAGVCDGLVDEAQVEFMLDGRSNEAIDFNARVRAFDGFVKHTNDPNMSHRAVQCIAAPQTWLLGTGRRSAGLAAECSMNYGYSLFHHFSVDDPSVVAEYLQPANTPPVSKAGAVKKAVVAVAGVCAATDEDARRIAGDFKNQFINPTIIGTPRVCANALSALAQRYNVEEIVVLDVCKTYEERRSNYELLAIELGTY